MAFGRKKDLVAEQVEISPPTINSEPYILVVGANTTGLVAQLSQKNTSKILEQKSPTADVSGATAVIALFLANTELNLLLDRVRAERARRKDGLPVLIIATRLAALAELGAWLKESVVKETLEGVRLLVSASDQITAAQIEELLEPITEPSFIKMPVSTEVECNEFKYFYCISSKLRRVVNFMKNLAENNVSRIYLLGGPGAGKTSLAYYFWLCRKKGQFVSVNLTAESTTDKAAMKSLLCGHVTGAFPGSGSREGSFYFAGPGVCFLDESHGVSGIVMQVLMEVLDSNQYLPFGASKKRALECAVVFASNRSWETLRKMIHIDEHARLGATVVTLSDLSSRIEDLIAVLATMLAKQKTSFTSWSAPDGLSPEAWELIKNCPWRGNIRTLMRVLETACVNYAQEEKQSGLLEAMHISKGLELWEPIGDTHDEGIYVSIA